MSDLWKRREVIGMSATPRTDAGVITDEFDDRLGDETVTADFARQLERELSAAMGALAECDAKNSALKHDILKMGGETISAELVALELQRFVDLSGDIDRAKKALYLYRLHGGAE